MSAKPLPVAPSLDADPVDLAFDNGPMLGPEDVTDEERASLEHAIREMRDAGPEPTIPHAEVTRRVREHHGVK
ncbi:MAG: hypothetical protein KIT84_29220 [Labilithrix sp.]|nr:hypothetical protein [Labilithrix sp.]MCW5815143.1 hypothetical protein [Labilithrix sp.]